MAVVVRLERGIKVDVYNLGAIGEGTCTKYKVLEAKQTCKNLRASPKETLKTPASPQFARNPINLPRRTFTLAAQLIHRLKQRIANLTTSVPSVQPTMAAPSSFVAIAALTWVSFVRSKHPDAISGADDVYLLFFYDCRGRRGIDPQVSDNYFGTCITGFLAKATASELLAEDGVAVAAAALQGEVRRAAENPVAGWNWLDLFSWLPPDRLVNVSGSTRFAVYEAADFGWGAPSRTELVSVNNGQVVLVAAKGGCGGVQASVCMHPDHMDAFSAHFLNCLVD